MLRLSWDLDKAEVIDPRPFRSPSPALAPEDDAAIAESGLEGSALLCFLRHLVQPPWM